MAQLFPAQISVLHPHTQRPVVPHKQLSKEEWKALEPFVRLKYQNATLKSVMKSIEREYRFIPTRRQMTRKLTEWGIEKLPQRIEKRKTPQNKCTSKCRVPQIHNSRIDTVRNERLHRSIPKEGAGSNQVIVHAQNQGSSVIDDHTFVRHELSYSPSSTNMTSMAANDFTNLNGRIHSAQENPVPLSPPDTELIVTEWEELEPDVEIIPRVILEDAWPFSKRSSRDASGRLDLSQLFEFLDLETNDLPSIESLITSWDSSMHLNSNTEEIYISGSELTLVSRGDDLPHFLKDIRMIQYGKQYDKEYSAFPFKGRVVNIDFPSGHAMNPCPFNEVYPFPSSAPQMARARNSPGAVSRPGKIEIEQCENELDQLRQTSDEADPQVLRGMESLAALYFNHGEYIKAEHSYEKLVATLKEIDGEDKDRIFDLSLDLIDCLAEQGRNKEAYTMHQNILKEILATLAPENEITIRSLKLKIHICSLLDLREFQETACRQVVQITLNTFGAKHAQTKEALAYLGSYLRKQREFSESERLLATAVQLGNAYAHDSYKESCENMISLALTLWKQDRSHEALRLLRVSVRMAESYLGVDDEQTRDSYFWTGMVMKHCNEWEESEIMLRMALGLWTRVKGESDSSTLNAMAELGRTLRQRENFKEAIELLQKALPGLMQIYGPVDSDTINCCLDLARCLEAQGHWDLALAQCEGLAEEIRNSEGGDHPSLVKVQEWLDYYEDRIAAEEEMVSYDDSESESSEEIDAASENDLYSEEGADSEAGSLAEKDKGVDCQSSKTNSDVSITEDFQFDLDNDSQFQGIDMSTPKWP